MSIKPEIGALPGEAPPPTCAGVGEGVGADGGENTWLGCVPFEHAFKLAQASAHVTTSHDKIDLRMPAPSGVQESAL